jgi:hypothetical protein
MKPLIYGLIAPLFVVACGQNNHSNNQRKEADLTPTPTQGDQSPTASPNLRPDPDLNPKVTPERFVKCDPQNFIPLSGSSEPETIEQKFAYNFVPSHQNEGPIHVSVWGWKSICQDGIHKIQQYGIYPTNINAKKENDNIIRLYIQKDGTEYNVGAMENGRPLFCQGLENCTFSATQNISWISFSIKSKDIELMNQDVQISPDPELIPVIAGPSI